MLDGVAISLHYPGRLTIGALNLWIHSEKPGETHGRSGSFLQMGPELIERIESFLESLPVFRDCDVGLTLVWFHVDAKNKRDLSHALEKPRIGVTDGAQGELSTEMIGPAY